MEPQVAILNPQGRSEPSGLSGIRNGRFRTLRDLRQAHEMRALAPLPKNTEEMIERAIRRVSRQRLVIVEDLIAEGLTFPLEEWLSVPFLTDHAANEAGRARASMVPKARGERQVRDVKPATWPIYCVWDDFDFNIRETGAADRVGYPLSTDHAEQATRNVNEFIEDVAIHGLPDKINGYDVPGMLDTTTTQSYKDNEAWTAAGHDGQDIVIDVTNMAEKARVNGNFYGPFNLYVEPAYGAKLNQNFSDGTTTFDITIRERLERLVFGGRNLRVREADFLPTDRTLLVQMTSNVVDVVLGQTPDQLSWEDGPGFQRFFLILACIVMRLKADYNGKYGVVAGNKT